VEARGSIRRQLEVIARRRLHRTTFALAAAYNILWGTYSALDPQWLFRCAKMPPQNHPEVFVCLAMVVGLYGLVYLMVAIDPEHGWALAAVGLIGKVLGPLGVIWLIHQGEWTPRAMIISLTNDIPWWAPSGLYLYDAWPPDWLRMSPLKSRSIRHG